MDETKRHSEYRSRSKMVCKRNQHISLEEMMYGGLKEISIQFADEKSKEQHLIMQHNASKIMNEKRRMLELEKVENEKKINDKHANDEKLLILIATMPSEIKKMIVAWMPLDKKIIVTDELHVTYDDIEILDDAMFEDYSYDMSVDDSYDIFPVDDDDMDDQFDDSEFRQASRQFKTKVTHLIKSY